MASNSVVRQFVIDVISLLGIGFGAGGAAAAPVIDHIRQDAYMGDQIVALTPAQAAEGVVKNAQPALDWAGEAAKAGINAERFASLVALTGNPPGPETLLAMWRRGFTDEAGVDKGMRQGYLKDEWIDAYKALADNLLPPAEIVQAAVQGHLTDAEARALWHNVGQDDSLYDVAFETAGNPPGNMETLTMLDRGIFTEAEATQALRESRLKDKYIPAFLELSRRRIPFRTLNTLVKNGAITPQYALQQLEQLGYTESDAQALIKSAQTATTTAHHQLTVGDIVALYEARKLSREQAVAHLGTLGYAPDVADELIQLGDVRALLKVQDQGVTAVRSRFIAHRITEPTARADLTQLGLPGDQIDELMRVWSIELTANPRELTEAQLRGAVKANVITVADYTARLVGMGYTTEDANILTETHFPPTTGG